MVGATALQANDAARATAVLARARLLASKLATFNGEHLFDDAVAAIERANPENRAILAEAQQTYFTARRAYGKRENAAAESGFRRAAALFTRGGSPLAGVADSLRGEHAVRSEPRTAGARGTARAAQPHRCRASSRVERIDQLDARGHREQRRRCGDRRARVRCCGGDLSRAGRGARRGLRRRIRGPVARGLGDADAAWSRRIHSLEASCGGADGQRCNGILADAAGQLIALDQAEAALALTGAMLEERQNDPYAAAMHAVHRARVANRAGNDDAARDALATARGLAARIPDPAQREGAETQREVEEAALQRAHDPRAAIASLTRSADFLAAHDVGYLIRTSICNGRGAADGRKRRRRAGRLSRRAPGNRGAEKEVADPGERLAFLDTGRQALDETIELELARGDVAAAFRVADARHQLQPASGPRRVTAGTAAIEYAVLPRGVAIFCLTGESIAARRVDVDRRELDAKLDAFVSAIRRRASIEDVRAIEDTLLIAPVRTQLAMVNELTIVPDRQLYGIPFAALRSGQRPLSRRGFRHPFRAGVSSPPMETMSAFAPALVVGDPPSSRPRLQGSRDEAAQVASLQQGRCSPAIRPASAIDAARQSALIYFAGHARSDSSASNGALLLAGGPLEESDIARLRLERHPLVVLAACGTLRGDPMHVAGMSSLLRASCWPARGRWSARSGRSRTTSPRVSLRLQENLRADPRPARALRDAQRALLHSSDPRLTHPARLGACRTARRRSLTRKEPVMPSATALARSRRNRFTVVPDRAGRRLGRHRAAHAVSSGELHWRGDVGERAMNAANVEEHETILVFTQPPASGWTPAPFHPKADDPPNLPPRWYVRLDGEKIRFITNSRTKSTTRTQRVGLMATPIETSVDTPRRLTGGLGLPHAGECCAHPALRPEYTPATNYRLAAAVIDLSNASAAGCLAMQGRKDTVINLVNDGTLIVEAASLRPKKGPLTKTLTFDGSAYLVFANVPVDATGGKSCGGGNAHYMAYGAMVQSCTDPIPCPKESVDVAECVEKPIMIMPTSGEPPVRIEPPPLPQMRLTASVPTTSGRDLRNPPPVLIVRFHDAASDTSAGPALGAGDRVHGRRAPTSGAR